MGNNENKSLASVIDIASIEDLKSRIRTNRAEKTPSDHVKQRKGSWNNSKQDHDIYNYVDRMVVQVWLDEHYPGWSWEFDSDSITEIAGFFKGSGLLTVYEQGIGIEHPRKIKTIGTQRIKFKKDDITKMPTDIPVVMEYAKGVDSDALKRAVFTLGGFSDIYAPDYKNATEIVPDLDYDWILFHVPSILTNTIDSDKIAKLALSYLTGKFSKEQIINKYNDNGINLGERE